jgi:tetratricopeptide (TPR) repeat protein
VILVPAIDALDWLYEKGRDEQERESYDDARARYNQILDMTRETDWVKKANAGLAEVYLSEGNLFWAMDHIHRALKRDSTSGRLHYIKGKIHLEREEYREAADEALKAVEGNLMNGRYYHLLARALYRCENLREARRFFEWAMECEPDNLEIRFDFVRCEIEESNFQRALQLLKAALDGDQDNERIRQKIRAIQENWEITGS